MLNEQKTKTITGVKALIVLLLGVFAFCVKAEEVTIKALTECSQRGGLSHFFDKLKQGKKVKIAYWGGSITEQNGWRVLSRIWFQKQFSRAKVEGIHAAIGGTVSELGVFRMDRDVLSHKPDLVFVEFAVNDKNTPPVTIRKAFEGIIRKIWKEVPECDICFVYTVTIYDEKALMAGNMKRSASVMDDVADYYGIPSIHMGVEITNLLKADKLCLKASKDAMTCVSGDELNKSAGVLVNKDGKIPFARDGVHPYADTGHKLYLDAIARSMPIIAKAGNQGLRKIPTAMGTNWETAKMLPLSNAEFSKTGWTKLDDSNPIYTRFKHRLPEVWKGVPGASLRFKFKGTKVLIYNIIGPSCGMVEITIDDKTSKQRCIDPYCSYYRLTTMSLDSGLPDKEHTVEIKVLGEKVDKSKVLYKSELKDLESNPDKYKNLDFYAGAILIIGEFIQ